MSFYISKINKIDENIGNPEYVYYCGDYTWSTKPEKRKEYSSSDEATNDVGDFGGEVFEGIPESNDNSEILISTQPLI